MFRNILTWLASWLMGDRNCGAKETAGSFLLLGAPEGVEKVLQSRSYSPLVWAPNLGPHRTTPPPVDPP